MLILKKLMNECNECGLPEPYDKNTTLHYENCINHNIETCEACKELIKEENYEEMVKVKKILNERLSTKT